VTALQRRPDGDTSTTTVTPPVPRATARQGWRTRYSRRLQVTDTAIICASVFVAQYVRFGELEKASGFSHPVRTLYSLLFAALWLLSLAMFQTRSLWMIGAGIDEYRRIVSASFWTFGVIAMVTLLAKIDLARGYLSIALPVGTIGLVTSRIVWRKYIDRGRAQGKCQTQILSIGDEPSVLHLAQQLARSPGDGYVVVGFCIPGYGPPRGEALTVAGREIPILGDETHAVAAVNNCRADTVAVARTNHFGVRAIKELMWRLETADVDLVVSPGVMDVAEARLSVRLIAGLPLLHVAKSQYEGTQRFQKQALDVCLAVAVLVAASPILLAAALAIKLTSKGPVFYPSERIGMDGKPFTMLKFRTMKDGADTQVNYLLSLNESAGGMLFKMRQDPRVTPVGRVLRRFSIDELPQFVNVIKGDMSVVGPRPPLRREVENYSGVVMRRMLVKPGVSGLWQVSGRSDLSWEDSVRLDLSYVDNWSMAGDLVIIVKTVKAVLKGHGAY
jgi:exopolysaccharide biosynthesis polyprenyl glycosylphosphotransferase